MFGGLAGVALGLIELDIDGFLLGPEVAATLAALFSAFFGGIVSVLIGQGFGGTA